MSICIGTLREDLEDNFDWNEKVADFLLENYFRNKAFYEDLEEKNFVVKGIKIESDDIRLALESIEIDMDGHIEFQVSMVGIWIESTDAVEQETDTIGDEYEKTGMPVEMEWDDQQKKLTMSMGNKIIDASVDYDDESMKYSNLRILAFDGLR
jgi:hypothetical protein